MRSLSCPFSSSLLLILILSSSFSTLIESGCIAVERVSGSISYASLSNK